MASVLPPARSLGGAMPRRQLRFFYVLDRSGSMRSAGKIAALNTAMTESLPLLRAAALDNATADVLVNVALFADDAVWVEPAALPVEQFTWRRVDADGFSDLGKALRLVAAALTSDAVPEGSLAPVVVLVSDGRPTDDYRGALEELRATAWGARATRIAVALGEDADRDALQEFLGRDSATRPLSSDEPEALVEAVREATRIGTRTALHRTVAAGGTGPEVIRFDDDA